MPSDVYLERNKLDEQLLSCVRVLLKRDGVLGKHLSCGAAGETAVQGPRYREEGSARRGTRARRRRRRKNERAHRAFRLSLAGSMALPVSVGCDLLAGFSNTRRAFY